GALDLPCLVFGFVPQQQKNLEGYVGFANLPNQVYRKSVKRGFEFTLMVVDSEIVPRIPTSCPGFPPPAQDSHLLPRIPTSCSGFPPLAQDSHLLLRIPTSCPGFPPLAQDSHLLPRIPISCPGKDSRFTNILKRNELQVKSRAETFGESGLGKSTLINSLFLTDLYSAEYPGPSHRIKKTVQACATFQVHTEEVLGGNSTNGASPAVEQSKVLVKEGGVQLLLTIVDTPGFGDAVDNSNCWQPVIDHIDSKFEDYLNAESRVNRRQMPDNRVHCCLYFIAPSGHGLKPLDIEFMKRLHEKVNIIPLIAKADTLTPEECQQFKKQVCVHHMQGDIMREIQEHKIKIYEFPETDDEEENKLVKKIKDRLPLAVVGSNTIIEVNGKRVRGRQYPWGVAEVENGEHCDFTILRNMLIRTHMQDLKDVTNNVHYENYRSRKLAAVTYNGADNNKSKGQLTKFETGDGMSPLAQMEEERREHVAKMKKMEMEMEQVFEMKVKEKLQKLKDSETELQRRHEQMKKNLEAQHKELEEKRRQFEEEKVSWEAQQRLVEQQKLDASRTLEKNKKKKIF
ncbi:hypothetical protein QTP70_028164, partial [Hemibagrus guttatus]